MGKISSQYNFTFSLLNKVTSKFFALGSLLDESYLNEYNRLMFSNICSSSSCLISLGEDKGLNNILLNYYGYLVGKYQSLVNANGTYNVSNLYPISTQTI